MHIRMLNVGPFQVNCYLVGCDKTGRAVAIDPGGDGERILAALREEGWELQTIINTHGHFDHVGANGTLVDATGAELMIHKADLPLLQQAPAHAAAFGLRATPSPQPARTLSGGELLKVGEMEFRVIHTPGHSLGGICLLTGSHLFTGDALFAGSIGRTDLPGGNTDILIAAIHEHLLVLPDETVVYPGHGPDTTIGREKRTNMFLI